MLKITGRRGEIFSLTAPEETKAMLLVKPSRAVFAHLLSNTGVKEILCPPGVYATIPKKVIVALRESGVEVKIAIVARGRPREISADKFELARGLSGKVGTEAAIRKAGIARSTYYYRLKQEKSAGN